MAELKPETQAIFTNPDGRPHPVIYNWLTGNDDNIRKLSVRIVNSNNQTLDYIAINPVTQKEVKLGATHWVNVYRSLLNKQPPSDLDKRVRLYYQIRERKARERAAKDDAQYSPFDDPEQIAA